MSFTLRRDDSGVAVAAFNELEDLIKFTSLQKKWRSDFVGSSLSPDKWEVVTDTGGMTAAVSGGNLTITTGTASGAEYAILSKEIFTISIRALFQYYQSAKVANTEVYLELVSVDPVTGQPDGQHAAGWLIDGSSATTDYLKYFVKYGGQTDLISANVDTNVVVTSSALREIELFPDEAWFHCRALDSTGGRTTSFLRNQQIPDPNAFYKVRLRVKNAAAPASSTTVYFQGVSVVDFAELTTEVTAGRGVIAAGQALAATITNTVGVNGYAGHDGTSLPNPVMIGAIAHATGPTAVSGDNDFTRLWADRQGRLATWNPPIGTHANAWNNIAVLAAGVSASVDTIYCQNFSVFGNASAATNITVQFSQDNVNFYDSEVVVNLAAAGNFGKSFNAGARYLRLKSSAAATITATIAGTS